MRIVIARTAGYCWGVRRTMNKVSETAGAATGPVATLGPVIHNPQALESLKARGVQRIDRVEDVPEGTTLILRTHGAVVEQQKLAQERGLTVVDGTCPYVKFPQVTAQRLSREGYHLILVGDASHAEVKGVASHAEGPVTIVAPGEKIPDMPGVKKVAVLSQTTNDVHAFQAIVAEASARFREVRAVNTICFDTGERQTEVGELAAKVDVLLVVGGMQSANTRHLADIGAGILSSDRVHHVERASEIDPAWFTGAEQVGISAGASTPDEVIEEVAEALAAMQGGAERAYHEPSFEPSFPNR